jgi:hypothetical protein
MVERYYKEEERYMKEIETGIYDCINLYNGLGEDACQEAVGRVIDTMNQLFDELNTMFDTVNDL